MADRSVVYRLKADVGQFKAQMAQASASVKKSADDMTAATKQGAQFRQGLDTLGGAAGKAGLVAAAGLGASVKAAMDWETAWVGVTKTVDGSATQMAALEGQLRQMARTLPATHTEIAAVAEAAGQLGVKREAIASFTETMIALGETTNLTADEAATSIAQMANVMQTAPSDVDNLGAALVALGNDGASTERDIIQMAQRISAAGAQIGLAESDVLAIANAASSMGIEVEAGGTAITRVFTELAKATATGGPKLEAFAATAGMSADEFTRLFESTPADAFAAFTSGLDRINKSGGNVFGTLKQLGMSDVRVSQALLGMAASGDLLTDSLKLGREAWKENTALSDEFGKRLGTTASQVQVSWNNIKDAAIDVGAAVLPVVEGIAKAAGNMASVFGALPGPVKGGAGALLGLTAVAGGSVWAFSKMVNGVASARDALNKISGTSRTAKTDLDGVAVSSSTAGSKLGMIASRGAAILAVGTAVGVLADNIGRIDTANVGRSLDALGRGETTKEIRKVVDDLAFVTDKWNKIDLGEAVTLGGLFGDSTMDKYQQNIDSVDQALANLVETGEKAKAQSLFADIVAQAGEAGVSAGKTKAQFDAYALALRNAGGSATESTGPTAALGRAAGDSGAAAGGAATDFAAMAKAQKEARDAATKTATSFFNLGDSLNDSKVSLSGWIQDMNEQATALRDFRVNAETAANRGLRQGLIAALQEAGPEGARRMKQLANASDSEIAKANRAWRRGQKEIRDYANEVGDVPKNVGTNVNVTGTQQSIREIRELQQVINSLRGRNITNYVNYVQRGGAGRQMGGVPMSADGSTVPKTGLAYADRHPYLLADGEEVISNRYGQADRHRALLKAINANRLADGGTVRGLASGGTAFTRSEFRSAARNFDLNASLSAAEAARELRSFAREVKRSGGHLSKNFDKLSTRAVNVSKSLNRQQAALESLRSRQADARSGAASAFNSNAFGGTLADMVLQLQADRNDSNSLASLTANLRGKGATTDFLASIASSGNLGLVQELASASRAQVLSLQSLYGQRATAQAAAGNQAAAGFNAALSGVNNTMHRLILVQNKLEKAVERGAERGISKNRKASKAKGKRR